MKTQLELVEERIKYELEKEYAKIEAAKNVIIGLQNALNIINKGLVEENKSSKSEDKYFVDSLTGRKIEVPLESKVLRDSKGFAIGGKGGAA